jgi:hypothetical protein
MPFITPVKTQAKLALQEFYHFYDVDGLWCKNKVDKKGEERVFLVYDKQEKNTLSPKRIIPCSELGCI